ncbi:hypothetical protein L0U85_00630 [Glycomyces sp. L485]|uniref:hypothetical protein n=1 Tax=Glycomyces sp. L485 TaxID=2909235 RepID=UPI001F4AE73D|nr:hypothetical protein [Glycomyces sp. L485]MCH7229374.1 hypothetical protein [Glycomyces sp. L485]
MRQLGVDIENQVVPILEEAAEILPDLRDADRGLYTAVTLPMAAAYTAAVSTVAESMAGAAECFRDMHGALEDCASDYEACDAAVAQAFGGE